MTASRRRCFNVVDDGADDDGDVAGWQPNHVPRSLCFATRIRVAFSSERDLYDLTAKKRNIWSLSGAASRIRFSSLEEFNGMVSGLGCLLTWCFVVGRDSFLGTEVGGEGRKWAGRGKRRLKTSGFLGALF